MEIRRPAYFDAFHCLAGACPDSCCKEWEVLVDAAAADHYRTVPGVLGEQLRKSMICKDDQIWFSLTENRKCPLWQANGLCHIQMELGEAALCETCRSFPRLTHDYGDFIERGLELSCPEAARLMLSGEQVQWVTETLPGGIGEYDRETMRILLNVRQQCRELLYDRTRPVSQVLALLLVYGYQAQAWLDGGEEPTFAPENALEMAAELACPGGESELVAFFQTLEILTEQWRERLAQGWRLKTFSEKCRPLADYFVQRYCLQAVADYDLVGRIKLAVISCLLINGLGGNFQQTAQLYAKEIENDAENVDAILDGAYTAPALTDAALLGMLLCQREKSAE